MITGAADGRSEYRLAWGEAGRDEKLEPGGTAAFSGGTALAGWKAGNGPRTVSSLAFLTEGRLVLLRQCSVSCFFVSFYLASEIVNN